MLLFQHCCTSRKDPPRKDSLLLVSEDTDEEEELEEVEQEVVEKDDESFVVLLEIVGAMQLDYSHRRVNASCVVRLGGRQIHRTKVIHDDPNPIWTIQTNSLCLIEFGKEELQESALTVELVGSSSVGLGVVGSQSFGTVEIPLKDILKQRGERIEYPLQKASSEPRKAKHGFPLSLPFVGRKKVKKEDAAMGGTVALRFRPATDDDCLFLKNKNGSTNSKLTTATDIHFQSVRQKSLLHLHRKRDEQHGKLCRVQPFPDPNRKDETTWMTPEQLHQEALQPSKQWHDTGMGSMGYIDLEVIGCNNLPNMDVDLINTSNKTDAFCGIVFEGSMVRTCIVHDSLNPRFVPWAERAFRFRVHHPASILLLAVFDYDLTSQPDPIGRVVIDPVNFESDTTYLLHYPLHHDPAAPCSGTSLGEVIVRMRIHWRDEEEANIMRARSLPPRYIINVKSDVSYRILRYVTTGALDMETASIESLKLYIKEFLSYWKNYCYVLDVLIGVLLWRGRLKITDKVSIWFPIHSMALFAAVVVAIEHPRLIPSFLYFGIAWIMLSLNYHASHHPNPWKRVRPYAFLALFGFQRSKLESDIKPNEGAEAAARQEELDRKKAQRVSNFIYDSLMTMLKVWRIYKKTKIEKISITTVPNDWTLPKAFYPVVYYPHMLFMYLCTYTRLWLNVLNWRSSLAHKLTTNCLLMGIIWLFLPKETTLWSSRVFAWTLLGPWMKLLDVFVVHKYYATSEELLGQEEDSHLDDSKILNNETLQRMGHAGRITTEDAVKLKAMREHLFGGLSCPVPKLDTSRYPSVPSSSSTAEPGRSLTEDRSEWHFIPGQRLEGAMIPRRPRPLERVFKEDKKAIEHNKVIEDEQVAEDKQVLVEKE